MVLLDQLERHEWLSTQVHNNLEFFGSPIFYSSRSRAEMVEANLIEEVDSVARASGFGSQYTYKRIKARSIIDNLESDERIGFATPQAIDSTNVNYIENYEADLRAALGSVDENQVSNLVGLGYKTALSRAINTAGKRAKSYLDHGIIKAYELMLSMAIADEILPQTTDKKLKWRYLGDVFPKSSQETLTDSIVARNLLRLGASPKETMRFLFPDKEDSEIDLLLEDGFPYEYFNGITNVSAQLKAARDDLTHEYALDINQLFGEKYLNESFTNSQIAPGS